MNEITLEPIKIETTYQYKWFLAECERALPVVAVSIAFVVTIKVLFSFILALRRKKEEKKP